MPVPEGHITGASIWQHQPDTEEKQYEVIATYKTRKRMVVSASDENAARQIAEETFDLENLSDYDELISDYSVQVKEA